MTNILKNEIDSLRKRYATAKVKIAEQERICIEIEKEVSGIRLLLSSLLDQNKGEKT